MSLTLLASNNASTVLASSINASATTLTVNTGAGSLFPSPVSGTSFFKLTLVDAATGQLTEIVHVTARAGDVMTIERAQEGTAARVWSANDIAANMMTAGTLSYILGSFQPLDATLTALAGLTGSADKLAYFNGDDTAALTALTGVGRDIIGKTTIADVLSYLQLRESFSGVVGATRNAMMNIATASATATFSADELIVEDSNGRQYRLSAFSKTINLATVGAGGMDTGTVPASGFIALYAIFNPATTTSSLLAVDATNSILPDVYGGASMPAGYTASSLVSVWRVAGSKLVAGNQVGRDISIEKQTALSSTAKVGALTALSIAAITPKNAKAVSGYTSIYSTNGAGGLVIDIASTSGGLGYISTGGYTGVAGIGANGQFSDLALITPQTMYYDINPLGTAVSSWSALIAISRYSI